MNESSATSALDSVESASLFSDFVLLTKARLSFLVLVTTFIGFCTASSQGHFDWPRLFWTLIGTGLVAGAAAAFNQIIEMNVDRLMERTRTRPLPAGRITRTGAFLLASAMTIVGLWILAKTTTTTATLLAAFTLLVYIAFYTPLKRRSSTCVTVGAISGAIPPVIGWTAVDGTMGLGGWVLFGILFAWQMPHFLALAWLYRQQYGSAGFVMLSARDTNGTWAATQSFLYSVALLSITLIPFFVGRAGVGYLIGALVCNLPLLAFAFAFLRQRNQTTARTLFIASIIYLPVQLTLMLFA